MAEFDLTRDVAEKVLKRAMAPVREILHNVGDEEMADDEQFAMTLGTVRELDRDLGAIGLALATRYREQVEYQTALGVMAAENVRLQTVVEQLTALASKYKAEGDNLADALTKERTVSTKLKEVIVPQGTFHAS